MTTSNPPSLPLLNGLHEELETLLPSLSPKLAAVKLLNHIRSLPDTLETTRFPFFHISSLRHLCRLILRPEPISGHVPFLTDLVALLTDASSSPSAEAVRDLQPARTRLIVLLTAEHAIRDEWDAALSSLRGVIDPDTRVPDPSEGIDSLLAFLTDVDSSSEQAADASPLLWPYHLLNPETDIPEGPILTTIVDGKSVPDQYREAYLAMLSADVTTKPRRTPGDPIIHAKDERGEDLPLSEDLKDLVREGIDRALVLLGPQAQTRARKSQIEAEISLRRPSLITDLKGRSILLPLTLILAHGLGEKLNLPFTISPAPSVVWTGDIDEHGNVKTVGDMDKKTHRVLASTASGFAFPSDEATTVDGLSTEGTSDRRLSAHPLSNLFDLTSKSEIVSIQNRNFATRSILTLKRKARPIGIAGAAILIALLIAFGFAVPRLASWLDATVADVQMAEDHGQLKLTNSVGRTLRVIDINKTSNHHATLADVDNNGITEILYATTSSDSVPSAFFCITPEGQELWRFRSGFQPGEQLPYPLENTFNSMAVYVRDLDHDGQNEVVTLSNHHPAYASQIALLTSNGEYISSFWNPGHLNSRMLARTSSSAPVDIIFVDIDGDGYDEIIAGGQSNRFNQAIIVILDPRHISGAGPLEINDEDVGGWQSYILFPDYPGLLEAMGCPRLDAFALSLIDWNGEEVIRVGIWGALSGTPRAPICVYHVNLNLEVVEFYPVDLFVTWARKAKKEGKIDFDVTSAEFEQAMSEIVILPGPPELLLP